MRSLLIAACAAAPLVLAAGSAVAQTTVSATSTTPLSTSTSGNIDVSASGAISVSTATPLITLNSNNAVTIEGSLVSNSTNNATGVLILGGNTGSLTSTGTIALGTSYVAQDTANSDGVVEAPFATDFGKAGVRLVGTSAFTGDLNLGGSGITLNGNNSYGVSIEAPLVGGIQIGGPISVVGDHASALRVLSPVSGLIGVSGGIIANGAGARGLDLEAAADSLRIYGSITTTAYPLATRPTSATALAKIEATPLDLQQSGAAVTVAGSLARGLFIAAPPLDTVSGTLADVDGDGVADGAEGSAVITSNGLAPAVLVGGGAGTSITLGQVGAGLAAYGLINRGSISGNGVYDGVTATALQLGNGGAVSILGGIRNTGTIAAATYEANAYAVHIFSGVSTPLIYNDGAITAVVSDASLTAGLGGASANGLLIEAGATVPRLLNGGGGSIISSSIGNTGLSGAVVDRSGTLSSVVNEGVISAARSAVDSTQAVTAQSIALDLRANTSGVTVLQQYDPVTTVAYGSTSGTADTATTTLSVVTPRIIGDVLLGSGPNSVDLEVGTLTGTLDLGGATASLILNGGSAYFGALRYTGSALTLAVNSGTLTQLEATTLKVASLNVGSTGVLNLAVDPTNNRSSLLQVSGAATIADGAKIGVQLLSAPGGPQTYTLISSPALSVASSDANLLASSSFLVAASLHSDQNAGTVTVTLVPRTAAELGLNASEGAALAPVVNGAAKDSSVSAALLSAQDPASFSKLYRQLLPEHSNGVFHAVDQATRNIADLSTEHMDLLRPGSSQGGVWMEEFLIGSRETRNVGEASHTGGFGLVGGATTSDSTLGAFGATFAYVNASSSDPDLPGDGSSTFSQIEGGLNWRTGWRGFQFAARGGGGYLWGVTRRQFVADATSLTSAVTRTNKGTWNGWTADARGSISYRVDFGKMFVQPQAVLDYVSLNQDGYTERFGGDSLNLVVGDRQSYSASITGSVLFGGKLGQTGAIRPTFEVGVRDIFAGDGGTVNAAFGTGGANFALSSTPITGAGGLAKLGMKYAGTFVDVEVAAKAQAFERYQEGDLKVAVSTRF